MCKDITSGPRQGNVWQNVPFMLNTEAGSKAKSISWPLGAQMGMLSGALLPPRGTHSGGFAGDVRAWNLGPSLCPLPEQLLGLLCPSSGTMLA